jgi:hypothetical protein
MSISTVYRIRVTLTEGPATQRFAATYDDTYDGAEDSSNRGNIGYGPTEASAVADLLENYSS